MTHSNKRIAPAIGVFEPSSKRLKHSGKDAIVDSTVSLTQELNAAKDTIDNTSSSDQGGSANISTIKLDTLPAEIQQQIYWLAVKDEVVYGRDIWFRDEFCIAYQVIRVASLVQQHVSKAVEVWGAWERKNFVKILIHQHDHELLRAPPCGSESDPWCRYSEKGWVPACDIGGRNI